VAEQQKLLAAGPDVSKIGLASGLNIEEPQPNLPVADQVRAIDEVAAARGPEKCQGRCLSELL